MMGSRKLAKILVIVVLTIFLLSTALMVVMYLSPDTANAPTTNEE